MGRDKRIEDAEMEDGRQGIKDRRHRWSGREKSREERRQRGQKLRGRHGGRASRESRKSRKGKGGQ